MATEPSNNAEWAHQNLTRFLNRQASLKSPAEEITAAQVFALLAVADQLGRIADQLTRMADLPFQATEGR